MELFGIYFSVLSIFLLIAAAMVMVTFVYYEKAIASFLVLVAGVAIVYLTVPALYSAIASTDLVVLFFQVVVYVAIGLFYALFKWRFVFLKSEETQNLIASSYAGFRRTKKVGEDTSFEAFRKSSDYPFGRGDRERITSWVLWWPIDAVITLLSDVITNIARWIADIVSGVFASMAASAAKKIVEDRRSTE